MACTYCYQHNKTSNKMSFEVAKKFIDDLLADKYFINTQRDKSIILDFIGGEPLMEIDLIDAICTYITDEMLRLDHPWLPLMKFSLCSNGILYNTPKVQNFFKKFGSRLSFSVSIDGNKTLHDACRIDLQGNGTYDRAIEAVHMYYQQFKAMPGIKMTLAPSNIEFLYDAVVNLIHEGYDMIHLNCVYENVWEDKHGKILYNQLKKVSDYLIENELFDKINLSILNPKHGQPLPETEDNNWCGGIAERGISVDYQGYFYPCLRYMNSSINDKQELITFGDIETGYLQLDKYKENIKKISDITRRSQSTDECFYCPVGSGCGWCSAYNYEIFGTVNKRSTGHCITHKARSLAIVYYWNSICKKYGIKDCDVKMHLPKEEALKIISEEEYILLQNLVSE